MPETDVRSATMPTAASSLSMSVGEFDFTALNLSEEWKRWKQRFEIFELASNFHKEDEKRRVAMLLHSMGESGIRIYNSFNLSSTEQYKYETVLQKFAGHFDAKCPITLTRHKFFTCKQKSDQSVSDFATELQNLSLPCKFGNLRLELVCDLFIAGLLDKKFQFMLLKEEAIDITKAVNMCKMAELSKEHVNNMHSESSSTVENGEISHVRSRSHSRPRTNKGKGNQGGSHRSNSNVAQSSSKTKNCYNCGLPYQSLNVHQNRCPAKSKTCFKCKKSGHFSSVCQSSQPRNVSNLQLDTKTYFVGEIQVVNDNDTEWNQTLYFNENPVDFKIDTGSPVNILPVNIFNDLSTNHRIKKQIWNLSTVSNERIPVIGSINLTCSLPNNPQRYKLEFVIVDLECNPLLGLQSCQRLNLVKRMANVNALSYSATLSKFSNVFSNDIGTLNPPYQIKLSNDAVPRIDAQRRIPFALRTQLQEELDRMESSGIIEKITEPTEWVNSIVVVKKKNNQLRICLDPRYLNKFIITSNNSIPTFESISSKIANAKYFSVLDCNSGFWMIPLTEDSAKICTFNSPLGGRYFFKKLPFGLSCASEAFQERINFLFERVDGVEPYLDDFLIWGSSKEEHDQRLHQVLKIAEQAGLKFNKSKCKFGLTEIKYLGHIFSANGITIDPDKISAVTNISNPTNVKELQRLFGVFNYLSKFIPNFAAESAPLRELLKKSNLDFVWLDAHTECLNKLKNLIASAPVLRNFDPSIPIVMSVDSSIQGVGAVLLQDSRPVAYASKALTECQKKWAQIEREAYAIVFGCLRFRQYIFGAKISVETDHKALETLFKKPLNSVPARIQRMMLKIQAFNLDVKYRPGKFLYIADTLSRDPLPNHENEQYVDLDGEIVCHVNAVVENLPLPKFKLDQIKAESNKDKIHNLLRNTILNGWPNSKNKLFNELHVFWNYRDELHVIDDLIFKNNALLIPASMQKEMLATIHEGHSGYNFCVNRSKNFVFWPSMQVQIKEMCLSCDTCITFSANNCKESLIPHEYDNIPWLKVACDLFEFNKTNYLIIVDYYSKFFEISKLNNISSSQVITHMKSIFARHGIPKTLICDSGTQFTSRDFKNFSLHYGFEYFCSSPYHHQSNGLAEAHVKIVKNILKKCLHDGTDPYLAILNFRNTPKNDSLLSPANLLFSRNLRTKLPCNRNNLLPVVHNYNNFARKNYVKNYYNKSARDMKDVNINDNVYFKRDVQKPWVKGKVVDCSGPRSFVVRDQHDKQYVRNRVHIKIPCTDNSYDNIPTATPISPSGSSYSSAASTPSPIPKRIPKKVLRFADEYEKYYK